MKLVWSSEKASKAYIDTVEKAKRTRNPGGAEFLSAIAAGYDAKLIVEVRRDTAAAGIATSVGLAVAAMHTRGRHVCMVADEESRRAYVEAMQEANAPLPEIVVGEAERAVDALDGSVDFLVTHGWLSRDVFRCAKLSHRGATLVYKNTGKKVNSRFCWGGVVDNNLYTVKYSKSFLLDNGLDIAYVESRNNNNEKTLKSPKGDQSRWIRHIDAESGEEHVFRR